MEKIIKIPEGYEARIEGDKVVLEPKESEDERIRKEIMDFIYWAIDRGSITNEQRERSDSWLAYLEKQKEQKPIFKKGDKVIWGDEEFNILDVNETEYNVGGYRIPFSRQNELRPIELQPAESSEDEEIRKFLIDKIKMCDPVYWHRNNSIMQEDVVAWLEKQKKHKPAEQVEISKSLSDVVIAELGKYNGENYWKAPWAIDSTGLRYPLYFATLGATWQKEQKPAEWSEEDEMMLEDIKFNFTYNKGEMTDALIAQYNRFFDKIKSLKPQPKQEWSEKDKSILNNIVAYKVLNIDDLEWLKSLPERFNLKPKQE